MERRKKPRIYERFQVHVAGVDEGGRKFETETVLDNLSATGLYLRMVPRVRPGDGLSVIVSIPPAGSQNHMACARIAARGTIRRVENHQPDCIGLALEFTRHRFV